MTYMSTSEKYNKIMELLEIHPDWSDRKIGRELNVDHKTVAKHKKALNEPENKDEKKETKDEIIKRLEKSVKELTMRLMEIELKLGSEENNSVELEDQSSRIKNQK